MIWRQKTFHVSRFTGNDLPKIREDTNSNCPKYTESANKQLHLPKASLLPGIPQTHCTVTNDVLTSCRPDWWDRLIQYQITWYHVQQKIWKREVLLSSPRGEFSGATGVLLQDLGHVPNCLVLELLTTGIISSQWHKQGLITALQILGMARQGRSTYKLQIVGIYKLHWIAQEGRSTDFPAQLQVNSQQMDHFPAYRLQSAWTLPAELTPAKMWVTKLTARHTYLRYSLLHRGKIWRR